MTKDTTSGRRFRRLRARLDVTNGRYNPEGKNLHFDCLDLGDADLYPTLLSLAEDGLRTVMACRPHFSQHAPYGDGMFWYDLFLIVRAAGERVSADKAQAYVPQPVVDQLLKVLFKMSRYSTVHDGDIAKRNAEALGGTLLGFYSQKRVRMLRDWSLAAPVAMRRFHRDVVKQVKEVRSARVAGATPPVTRPVRTSS